MRFPFLHKCNSTNSSWPWPICNQQPRTLSFRIAGGSADSAAIESAYTESTNLFNDVLGPEEPESVEMVIEGLRSSGRLFFEETGETNSILEESNNKKQDGFTLLKLESKDPYFDFRDSMEEMVEAHGMRDWENLEHLLSCYLKFNGKSNHGYIFAAFIDLLVGLAFAESDKENNVSVSSARTTTKLTDSSGNSCLCSDRREFPSSPLSFCGSCSSSDESCSVPMETEENRDGEVVENRASCLSSLLQTEIMIEEVDDVGR